MNKYLQQVIFTKDTLFINRVYPKGVAAVECCIDQNTASCATGPELK